MAAGRFQVKGDRNPATSCSKRSACSSDEDSRQSKRLVSERASSTNIHDLPEELLVEILCRMRCAKSVFACGSVSKTWLSLTLDPSFICRFLSLQREKQTLVRGTIINPWGDELLTTDLFKRFRSFRLEEESSDEEDDPEEKTKRGSTKRLRVLATWNDLALCRRFGDLDDGEYYICNPRTMQLLSLPPIHPCSCLCEPAVGFICEPFYKDEKDDNNSTHETKVIRIDPEYKCKVVRILAPEDQNKLSFEFKVQVFSNDIGEWRESLVSCPYGFVYSRLTYSIVGFPRGAFACNGMLYWSADIHNSNDLLGLGPLMINNKSTTTCSNNTTPNADPGYKFDVIKLAPQEYRRVWPTLYHFQARHGRLQLVQVVENEDYNGARLFVWEFEKEELEQMVVQGGGQLGQKHRNFYPIMNGVSLQSYSYVSCMEYIGSDPNDLDTCFVTFYVDSDKVIYKCNILTGEGSKMERDEIFEGKPFQIILPWWPTPVPRLRSHTAKTSSELVIQ